jgi:protein-tyrosine phosphatase
VKDFWPPVKPALWSWTDPSPGFMEFSHTAKALLVKSAKQIVRSVLSEKMLYWIRLFRELQEPYGRLYVKYQILRLLNMKRDLGTTLPADVRIILFICHGNIIRSPFASTLLTFMIQSHGYHHIHVISAGLSANSGRRADARAVIVAKAFGVSLDDHVAQCVTSELVGEANVIFVMDYFNEARLLTRYPQAAKKVFLLGSFSAGDGELEIQDPYHGQASDIAECYERVKACLQNVLRFLVKNGAPLELQMMADGRPSRSPVSLTIPSANEGCDIRREST